MMARLQGRVERVGRVSAILHIYRSLWSANQQPNAALAPENGGKAIE